MHLFIVIYKFVYKILYLNYFLKENKMNRKRVIETNEGIQSEVTVTDFNLMQRSFRDRGILETRAIIKSGINKGTAVEIGPGPGYLGLEWLKSTHKTSLIGVEISPAMIHQAEKNRSEYKLDERSRYIEGTALKIPLEDESADHIFSNGSLHEWENPYIVLSEVYRVLKPGGKLFISDLKRNLSLFITLIMQISSRGKIMKKGLMTSIQAAYTRGELLRLCEWSAFEKYRVKESLFGLELTAQKPGDTIY